MELIDAFTEEAISSRDTNIQDELEATLREIIAQVFVTNNINWSEDILNVALLCFVAGRTYQTDMDSEPASISIEMTPRTAREFIIFLTERGTNGSD